MGYVSTHLVSWGLTPGLANNLRSITAGRTLSVGSCRSLLRYVLRAPWTISTERAKVTLAHPSGCAIPHWQVQQLNIKANTNTNESIGKTIDWLVEIHAIIQWWLNQRKKNWLDFLERISSCRCTHLRLLRPWLAVLTLYRTRSAISTRRALPKAKWPIHEKKYQGSHFPLS